MSNEKAKPARRPYVKKQKETSVEDMSANTRRRGDSRGMSMGSTSARTRRPYSDASDIEPDRRTRRASSKKMKPADRIRKFTSDHSKGLIIIASIVATVWIMYPPIRGYYATKRNLEIYTAVADYLRTSNDEIEAKIENLNSEEGIKALAHERGLVEPGEIAIVIQEPEQTEPEPPQDPKKDSSKESSEEIMNGVAPKANSKGVQEKEKIKQIVETIRDEGSTSQKVLDFIFAYEPPNIKVL